MKGTKYKIKKTFSTIPTCIEKNFIILIVIVDNWKTSPRKKKSVRSGVKLAAFLDTGQDYAMIVSSNFLHALSKYFLSYNYNILRFNVAIFLFIFFSICFISELDNADADSKTFRKHLIQYQNSVQILLLYHVVHKENR